MQCWLGGCAGYIRIIGVTCRVVEDKAVVFIMEYSDMFPDGNYEGEIFPTSSTLKRFGSGVLPRKFKLNYQ